ncbi:hypothetical protein Vau01_107740 [Virgisporangium aurantiacum]|uniref:Uncharacterized protein n=2 Tax=Virgisporangium aurantiacum TaxID=175570 RepID=A0A8J3ZI60_9ACTN|nr:hypothetical protein Vau01_107740 [Virgisporangium aurantiacum]
MAGFGAAGRGFRAAVGTVLRVAGVRRTPDEADAGMRLAARYRWLLRAYPAAYRAERGGEILDTYLDVAARRSYGVFRGWPRPADVVDLVGAGVRARLRARGSSGLADAVPFASTFALCAAVALAAVWLSTVEPRAVPAGIELRTLGPVQSLGAVAWVGWILAGLSAVALPGWVTRRLVAGAVAVTVLLVPAAAVTPFERPPLLVLVPQVALGLLALGWRAHRGSRTAVGMSAVATAGLAFAAAVDGAPLYGYWATGRDVMAFVALGLVAGAVGTGFVRAFRRDARGWWATLLVLPPAALLVVQPFVRIAGDTTGLTTGNWWAYAAAATGLTLFAIAPLPLATALRSRWR